MRIPDVIVVGGGVIGLSIAYELSGREVAVTVIDQGPLGREASWAGAGMLPPGNPHQATTPIERLRGESHLLWEGLSRQLHADTGIDNGYCPCGALEIRHDESEEEFQREFDFVSGQGIAVERLTASAAREIEPQLTTDIRWAYHLPETAQVRNPRHLQAMSAACANRGVQMLPGTPVYDFERQGETIVGVRTSSGLLTAGRFVVAAGAWSQRLLQAAGCRVGIEPLRGQIVLLQTQPLPIGNIIQLGKRYLVPRSDGRILIGSTEENVGFNKQNTAEGIRGLLAFATRIVPCLAEAHVERTWAGLRPRSADGLPYLGRVPHAENLFVAAGHFRDGLQLSPITGKLIADAILEADPVMPLEDFACDRPQVSESLRNAT